MKSKNWSASALLREVLVSMLIATVGCGPQGGRHSASRLAGIDDDEAPSEHPAPSTEHQPPQATPETPGDQHGQGDYPHGGG